MDDDMKTKSESDFARIQATNHPLEEVAILARQEMQRLLIKEQHVLNRDLMKEQHELNKVLIEKQFSLTKASIIFALVGIILGAILTTYLPRLLLPDKSTIQKVSSEQSFRPTTETIGKATVKQEDVKGNEPPATQGKDDSLSSKYPSKKKHE